MTTYTDSAGDPHVITVAIHTDGARAIYYDDDAYTPAQARQIAAELSAMANWADTKLAAIPGEALAGSPTSRNATKSTETPPRPPALSLVRAERPVGDDRAPQTPPGRHPEGRG